MAQSDVDAIAERILRRERSRMMRGTRERLEAIGEAYERVAAELKRRMRGATPAQIERLTREALNAALPAVLPEIEAAVVAGASTGATTVAMQADAVLGAGTATVDAVAARETALRQAQAILRGRTRSDGLTLSARLRRRHRAIARDVAQITTKSIRAGESLTRTAERILDADDIAVSLPRYVRDIRDTAREAAEFGDATLFEEAITKWEREIASRGSVAGEAFTIRRASEQMVTDLRSALERGAAERIDTIVDRWALEKARYHARVIARSETVEAHRRAYVESTQSKPWVKGYRWSLGHRHAVADECDLLAGQDLHGLGPGGYPTNSLPPTPHPNDLCTQTAIIDRHHHRREEARREGREEPPREWESGTRETSEEWLRAQPRALQREILGPGRLRHFDEGERRVLGRNGVPRPLWRIEGRERPAPRLPTERRRARPIVQADRDAGQVEPFPEL